MLKCFVELNQEGVVSRKTIQNTTGQRNTTQ